MLKRHRIRLVLGSLGAILLAAACDYNEPAQPKYGYEVYDLACKNHIDDDYDGLIDCEDPDCIFTSDYCGEFVPNGPEQQDREDTLEECTDSEDNDANGQFDCGDPSCQGMPEVCCYKETNNEACYDGLDNDGNGFADCGDFQCRTGLFITVCREAYEPDTADQFPVCSDGIDNDSDGAVDCEERRCWRDPACQCHEGDDCFGTEDTLEACSDGLDNDADGTRDCGDVQCDMSVDPAIAGYCAKVVEDTLLECDDGKDNDLNGFADCEDNNCRNPNCTIGVDCTPQQAQLKTFCAEKLGTSVGESENTLEKCQDGIDNDGNGYTDCQDNNCDDDGGDLTAFCDEILERSPEKCSDGIDNDNNGYVDCGDYSCRNSDDPAVKIKCQESVAISPPWPHPAVTPDDNCSDGLDNDEDGFVDCEDWDCSWNPDVTVCQPPGERVCE